MKESHEVRPSQSPRPPVMHRDECRRPGSGRSLHRGTAGPCFELRNPYSAVAEFWGGSVPWQTTSPSASRGVDRV
jgi:hypothetical protein